MERDKSQKTSNGYLLSLLLVSLFISFSNFIFAPTDIYIANITYLDFKLVDIFVFLVVYSLICFFILGAIGYLIREKKIAKYYLAVLFALGVALYIQGNFLAKGYPLLDGEAILWSEMFWIGVINTVFWIAIIAGILFLARKKEKLLLKVARIGSLFILVIQVATIITLFVTTDFSRATTLAYLSQDHMFELSDQENIVTIISDTFEETYLTRALNEFPELAEDLDDFIFYEDTSGVSSFTYLSTSVLFTGEVFPVGMDMRSGTDYCYDTSTLLDEVHRNNYDINYYTTINLLSEEYVGTIDNLYIEEEMSANYLALYHYTDYLLGIMRFKYAPHFLKQYVPMLYSTSYAQSFLNLNNYTMDDIAFRDELLSSGVSKSQEINKQYIVYHLNGVHAPNDTDRNFADIQYPDSVSAEDRRYEEALAQIMLLKEFVSQLKAAGVYDNTTIIFTADHGHDLRYNTVLLIKPANYEADFVISKAPVSLLADYPGFILDLVQGKGSESLIYSIPEDSPRERYVYSYITFPYFSPSKVRTKILIGGRANESEKYLIISDEFYEKNDRKGPCTIGDKIEIGSTSPVASFYGFFEDGATYSKSAIIETDLQTDIDSDVKVTLDISKVVDDQQVVISVGGTVVYDEVLANDAKSISFTVDQSLIESHTLRLEFSFPNAVYAIDDGEVLNNTHFDSVDFDSFVVEL